MANEFLSIKSIARQALPRLIENLVFPNLICRDWSEEFVPGKGATVQVPKPVILTAQEFNESSGTSAQDVKVSAVDVTLDKLATVDVEFGAISRATDAADLDRLFIEPAAAALAEKINADGLALFKDIPYSVGTAGSTPNSLAIFAQAAKVLDDHKAPTTERRGVWSPACMASFRQIGDLVNAEKCGDTAALRAGSIGNIFGIENYMAQGVKTAVSGSVTPGGTGATGLKVKTAVTASDTVVLVSNATASATLTGKVMAGDILTIGGAGYVALTDAEADSNEIEVKLDRNLTAAANDAVTLTAGGGQNLVFHKNAFAFVTRPLAAPAGVESYTTSYNGVTLRVVRGYDMRHKKETLSMDVLYGYKTMYPELAVRALS